MKAYRFDILIKSEKEIDETMTLQELFNKVFTPFSVIAIDYEEVQLKDKYKKLLEVNSNAN